MVDIHAHILPGIDDGAPDMETALEMAAMAVESGVTVMVATPHSAVFGRHKNHWGEDMIYRLQRFREVLEQEHIPLLIIPGMEIYGTTAVPEYLQAKKLICLNHSRYPLVEFPFTDFGEQATQILQDLLARGYRPVVAHPERYQYVQENPLLLNQWVSAGCLLQVNKGSLMGRFGHNIKLFSMELVERGFAFVVASDAHSSTIRSPWMRDVQLFLQEMYSKKTAQLLLETRPSQILLNREIRWAEPHWFQ